LLLIGFTGLWSPVSLYAAVGCRLNNPDQDIKRLFPESTNYRTHFVRIDGRGGEKLYREIEKRLGDRWDPLWETADVPYRFYEVLKGPRRIGWVFGANQGYPGADNAQVIVATDGTGRIRELFFQKLPSLEREKFQSRAFYGQFVGLTLAHFYVHEAIARSGSKQDTAFFDPLGRIRNPAEKEREGFEKLLRGAKKILILFDAFWRQHATVKARVLGKVHRWLKQPGRIARLETPMVTGKAFFPGARRVVPELPKPADLGEAFLVEFRKRLGSAPPGSEEEGRLPIPVLLVYRLDNYAQEFVRGDLLGYLVLVPSEGGGRKPALVVAADTRGRIVGLAGGSVEGTGLSVRMKGLSLTNFYVRDAFLELGAEGGKVDKIGRLRLPEGMEEEAFTALLRRSKAALITLDAFFLENRYKREKIFDLVRRYMKKKAKEKEKLQRKE
jgi:hypothetical protein